jgi:hypothetical protein
MDDVERREQRAAWLAELPIKQAKRLYRPWGYGREDHFPKVGRFYLIGRPSDGRTVIVDPLRPWNDAALSVHDTKGEAEIEAQRLALMRPGAFASE